MIDKDSQPQIDTLGAKNMQDKNDKYYDIENINFPESEKLERLDVTVSELTASVEKSETKLKKPFGSQKQASFDPKKPTILIVDDHDEIRSYYVETFIHAGYNVDQAHDGLAGLDRAKKIQPDIIWTGIAMPRMDGHTLIEALNKDTFLSKIPVFVCSHRGDMRDHERMQEVGVADFILHGYVSPEEILDRVASHLIIHEDYTIQLNTEDPETKKLIKAFALDVSCPSDQHLALNITKQESGMLSARFICKDTSQDKSS